MVEEWSSRPVGVCVHTRVNALREYSATDYEACLAVFETNVPKFFGEAERTEYSAFLRALPGPYHVLVDATESVVGCGGYAMGEEVGVADLCWGMVRRDLHGRGLGRTLTELRIRAIRQDPLVAVIALNTSQHTVGFYKRLGFRTASVERDGYAPGLDRCEMRLDLEQ